MKQLGKDVPSEPKAFQSPTSSETGKRLLLQNKAEESSPFFLL